MTSMRLRYAVLVVQVVAHGRRIRPASCCNVGAGGVGGPILVTPRFSAFSPAIASSMSLASSLTSARLSGRRILSPDRVTV
jgi:hypothetical protein